MLNLKIFTTLFTGVILLSALGGCSSVPMGDSQRNAQLKQFVAPTEKAGIYVYRNESMGAAVTMHVDLDGVPIGQTAAKTFLYKEIAPGKHKITSTAENTDLIEIDAKPGTLSYIWQEVKMGILSARTKLSQVSEAEGKKGVLESNLAQTR